MCKNICSKRQDITTILARNLVLLLYFLLRPFFSKWKHKSKYFVRCNNTYSLKFSFPLVKRFCLIFLHHVENNWLFDWAHCCSPKNNEQNNLVHVYKLDSQFSFVFFFDPFKNGFIASLPLVNLVYL